MVSLLFSFSGRINRKQYWIGTSLAGFISLFGNMMLAFSSVGGFGAGKDPAAGLLGAATSSALSLPLFLMVMWASLAVQFKRFHDRGRTGWFAIAPLALVAFVFVTFVSDLFNRVPPAQLVGDMVPYLAILMLISLWFFIDLGCLPGVEGANKFGPPPGTPQAPTQPSRPSGAVDAASSLFGAQSAMDRAISEHARPAGVAARPVVAAQPAFAAPAPAPTPRPVATPAPGGFGRRVSR